MYIFIDESGDLGGKQSDVFVVGGFITNEPKRTAKAFRKWQHTHFPKKIRRKAEVKFTDTGLNEKLRLKTFTFFAGQDIRVFYVFFKIGNIPAEYRHKKGIESGLLYTAIVEQAIRLLLPSGETEFRLSRDIRPLKGISQVKFNEMLKAGIAPNLSAKTIVQVEAIDSSANTNIQIADWVCGALFRYYSKGRNGEEYFFILKNSVIAREELFKDYWENFAENKKSPFK